MTALGLGLGGSLSPLGIPGTTSFDSPAFTTHTETVSETVGIAESLVTALATILTDTVDMGSETAETSVANLFDSIGVTALVDVLKAIPAEASDVIEVSHADVVVRGILVAEGIGLAESEAISAVYGLTAADIIEMLPEVQVGMAASVSDTVTVAYALQAAHVINVVEQLGLQPALAATALYGITVEQTIGLADSLAQFIGGEISETISLAPAVNVGEGATISETVGVAEAIAPSIILRVAVEETVGLDPELALGALLTGEISEGIQLSAAYLAPGDSFTTWALNTRTGAVTEYSNYAFNSFARVGNKYLGASSSGLYELLGDDDDGTDIIADIKSGFMQWAGSRFTAFKAVYLGVRNGGDFVLKIITGDDNEYAYSVAAHDMRSTKVTVGKGIRTRYFAFELISTGQDFDLDTVEFVPLVSERRV
jgi:hypothetical protein